MVLQWEKLLDTLCCPAGNQGFGSFYGSDSMAAIWRHKNNTRNVLEIPYLILCFLRHLEINIATPNQANPGEFPFPLLLLHRGAAAGLRRSGAEVPGAGGLCDSAVCPQRGWGFLHHPCPLAGWIQGADHLRVCQRYLQNLHISFPKTLTERSSHPYTEGNSS